MSGSWVYKLHFWPPYKHAAHYSGKTDNPPQRLADHAVGRGARLTQVQLEAGGSWVLGLLEPGGAGRERQIKGHDAGRYCDVCQALKGYQTGELTAPEALAQAGWDRANLAERPLLLEMFGLPEPPGAMAAAPARPAPPEPAPMRPVPEPRPISAAEAAEIDALVDGLIAGWRAPGLTARPPPAPEPEPELEAGL
jgi:hypothetical protein